MFHVRQEKLTFLDIDGDGKFCTRIRGKMYRPTSTETNALCSVV